MIKFIEIHFIDDGDIPEQNIPLLLYILDEEQNDYYNRVGFYYGKSESDEYVFYNPDDGYINDKVVAWTKIPKLF